MNEKIKQLWEISKEQEEVFIKSLPRLIEKDDIPLEELLKLIRGAEYRRGKNEAQTEIRKEFLKYLLYMKENLGQDWEESFEDKIKELKNLLVVKENDGGGYHRNV